VRRVADWLLLVAALVAGFALGLLVILPIRAARARRDRKAPEESGGFEPEDHFSIPAAPPPPPPAAEPQEGIPTEWARRAVGPAEADRARGVCSGCGTKLAVTKRRPLRIKCPVCGRERLLA
jgi:hypothetical protein